MKLSTLTGATCSARHTWATPVFLILVSIFLISCGGNGSENGGGDVAPSSLNPPVDQSQGGFQSIGSRVLNEKGNIQSAIDSAGGQDIVAEYSVSAYRVEYITQDSSNALVKVSGLIAVPNKSTPSPLLSFQHGTIFKNADAPSFHLTASEKNPEIALASLGYIVFSSDYVGYGSSFGRKHPYLQKQPSSDAVLDLLQAGKKWLDINEIQTNGQLFMTGYSQGGYVTMAALKELQENPRSGFVATATVMGAGPYDLNTAFDKLLRGINVPSGLSNLAISLLEQFVIPSDAEVSFERTFLERFFADDHQDDVHGWRPDIPIKLIHGADDEAVPIESAESTVTAMQNLGADIELIECTTSPADHRNCIRPYINYMVNYFDGLRSD